MDLILLVLVLCVIVFIIWALVTKVFKLPEPWASAIYWGTGILILLYLLRAYGPPLPNLLP